MRITELRLPSLLLCAATSIIACSGGSNEGTADGGTRFDDGSASTSVIRVANHTSTIEALAAVTGLRRLDTLVDRVPLLDLAYPPTDDAPASYPGLTPTDSDFDTQAFGFDCVNGGTYRVRTVETFTDRIDMQGCDLDGISITGDIVHRYAPGTSDDTYESLQATSDDGVSETLRGRRTRVRTNRDSIPRTSSWSVEEYVRSGGGDALSIRDALAEVEVGPTFGGSQSPERGFDSTMSVTAAWTGDRPMAITTLVPFGDFADAGHYRIGTLRAVAADGSALEIVADNGDPDSFTVDVATGGATSAFTIPWGETNRLRCFGPAGEPESQYGCD